MSRGNRHLRNVTVVGCNPGCEHVPHQVTRPWIPGAVRTLGQEGTTPWSKHQVAQEFQALSERLIVVGYSPIDDRGIGVHRELGHVIEVAKTQLFHLSRDETTMQMVDLTVSNHKAPVKLAEAFPCKKPSDRPFSEIDKLR